MPELIGRLAQEQIVDFLTMHRIVHGLTLREVGEACSPPVAASTVMRYERRESAPTLDGMSAWAKALGFELEISLRARGSVEREPRKGRWHPTPAALAELRELAEEGDDA